jgi:hypothetical protein
MIPACNSWLHARLVLLLMLSLLLVNVLHADYRSVWSAFQSGGSQLDFTLGVVEHFL